MEAGAVPDAEALPLTRLGAGAMAGAVAAAKNCGQGGLLGHWVLRATLGPAPMAICDWFAMPQS